MIFEYGPCCLTGSQRHSLISSVTTVSSSRDELLEAFENLNRNPPPPVVYETEADSLSQPTDSSTGKFCNHFKAFNGRSLFRGVQESFLCSIIF